MDGALLLFLKIQCYSNKMNTKTEKQNTLVIGFFLIRALCAISWKEHPQPAKKDQFDVLTARGQSCAREYNDSSFPPYGFKITISSCSKTNITIQKFGICLEINCLKKSFKICHILFIQNPKLDNSIFHFVGFLYLFTINECPGLCWHKLQGIHWGKI